MRVLVWSPAVVAGFAVVASGALAGCASLIEPDNHDLVACDHAREVSVLEPATGLCVAAGTIDECRGSGFVDAMDRATCSGRCAGASESACLSLFDCRAAYIEYGDSERFVACWGTAPSGGLHDGACAGLDAFECSRHDNCSARYVHAAAEMAFDRCFDEPR